MADLDKILKYVNDAETGDGNALSEATLSKIGRSNNALVALNTNYQEFLADGSFTVPENVRRICVFGAGGGAGGDGSGSGVGSGQPGGCGAVPFCVWLDVTPGDVHAVTIGAGGIGAITGASTLPGGAGGDTLFGSLLTFKGAPSGGILQTETVQGTGGVWRGNGPLTAVGVSTLDGQKSHWANGGINGTGGTTTRGLGGGAGYGAGANGGTTSGSTGLSAAANSSAGGGGGGSAGGNGGNGGSGILIVFW